MAFSEASHANTMYQLGLYNIHRHRHMSVVFINMSALIVTVHININSREAILLFTLK